MTDIKKSRFTEEQIISFLKQAEADMQLSEARRLRELESKNTKFKRLLMTCPPPAVPG